MKDRTLNSFMEHIQITIDFVLFETEIGRKKIANWRNFYHGVVITKKTE